MQQRSQQQPSQTTPNAVPELIEGLVRSVCLTIEVFLHHGFGLRYVGCGFMGMVVILVFSFLFTGDDPRPLLVFLAAYGVLWLIATISMLIRCWRGKETLHSRYTGRPYCWRLLPTWKEENFKHVEALAVVLLGFGIHYLSRPLGEYLMLAGSLVFVRGCILVARRRNHAIELNDLVIEEQVIAERFHEMQKR